MHWTKHLHFTPQKGLITDLPPRFGVALAMQIRRRMRARDRETCCEVICARWHTRYHTEASISPDPYGITEPCSVSEHTHPIEDILETVPKMLPSTAKEATHSPRVVLWRADLHNIKLGYVMRGDATKDFVSLPCLQ